MVDLYNNYTKKDNRNCESINAQRYRHYRVNNTAMVQIPNERPKIKNP